MPFRSEKQRRYLWKHEPKIAREWTDEYGSKPQPKKKTEGGFIKRRMQLAGPKELKKIIKEMEKNKFVRRRLKLSGGKAKGGGVDVYNRGRLSPEDLRRAEKATEGFKQIVDKVKREKRSPTKSEMEQMLDEITGRKSPSYLKGKEKAKEHKEKIQKLGKKALGYWEGWIGKKKGGKVRGPRSIEHNPHKKSHKPSSRLIPKTKLPESAYWRKSVKKGGSVKKNGPVRPIDIPWDSQKKKKGGIMEPYRGSYISGKVDGKMLSNPSLRKYYKGLI